MKLIKPSYEILTAINSEDILAKIERAGRTCYKSENNITKASTDKFVGILIKSGHESVIEHESISVRFITDRGVSHELVRHRLASFSQESTRYCNYSKDKFNNQLTFIIPPWIDIESGEYKNSAHQTHESAEWMKAMLEAEANYLHLVDWYKWTPQEARSVLPNSLKTEIVVTANLREWRTIFKQRTSTAAHPQMRELMIPLLKELQERIPVIFDDIKV